MVVLGVGSELRGDDAIGLKVVEKLQEVNNPRLVALAGGTVPENLTGEIKRLKPSHLIIVDAADLKEAPGTIKLINPEEIGGYSFSTHALPLKVLIDFIREDWPCKVTIIVVQPKSLSFNAPFSAEATRAVSEIITAFSL